METFRPFWFCMGLIMVQRVLTVPDEIRVGFVSDDPIFGSLEDGLASLELAVIKLKEDNIVPHHMNFK